MRMVDCQKLKTRSPGLTIKPYPGELGQRIFDHISNEAWQAWLNHQTMLINEYHLSMLDAKAREFLKMEMEKFLFTNETSEHPAGYVPPTAASKKEE